MPNNLFFAQETIKRGSPFPQGQEIIIDYDPSRGFIYRTRYDGISQTQLAALQQSIIANGVACRLRFFKDVGTLDVDDSTSEYTIDSWEIVGNEESKDGLSHPSIIAIIDAYQAGAGAANGTAGDVFAAIRAALDDNENTTDTFTNGSPLLAPYAGTLVEFAYTLQQRGSGAFRYGQYVLRHRTNVSNRWLANVADVGIDQVYTTAQLLTEVTDSGLWIFPLPPRLQFKLAAIPAPVPQTNYLWGWLKAASTETTAANNRVDIATDYTLEQWAAATDVNGDYLYYAPFDGNYGNIPYY